MASRKSKVLVVGGTGYIGRRIVKVSLAQGHPTYVLQRPAPEIGLDIEKLQMLLSFKKLGARLIEGSFSDFQSLVDAVKLVDVVICTMSGNFIRSHNIMLQLKLVEAIKQAGNRLLPSEFGMDVARMENIAFEPGRVTFVEKMKARRTIEEANIPFTYVCGAGFAAYLAANLCQMGTLIPPKDKVLMYGDGDQKVVLMDEDGIATYTIKTIDDPKNIEQNVTSSSTGVHSITKRVGRNMEKPCWKELEKVTLSKQDFVASMKEMDYANQVGAGHFHDMYYEGCMTNFEVEENEEASKLYPEVKVTRMEDFLKIYI